MAKRKDKVSAADVAHIVESLRPLAVSMESLKPDPNNARTHDEPNIRSIVASLKKYGQRQPLVVNRKTGFIAAGNGRFVAAQRLGWTQIAVVWVDDSDRDHTGFALADNRTAELGSWDAAQLAVLVAELAKEDRPLVDDLSFAELLVASTSNTPLAAVDLTPPPKMAWALIGIPVPRYGETSAAMDILARIPGIIIETGASDHRSDEAQQP